MGEEVQMASTGQKARADAAFGEAMAPPMTAGVLSRPQRLAPPHGGE